MTKECAEFAARFFLWAHGSVGRPAVVARDQLDQLRAEHVEHLLGEGEPKGWASYALAAIQRHVPGARRRLPSARRLKSARGKFELPERAPPFSIDVVLAISSVMVSGGHPRSAFAVALAFQARCSRFA